MKVITPGQLADHAGSKYLGVLVAAKYARAMNEFRRGMIYEEPDPGQAPSEKLTTSALREVADGSVAFELVERRRDEG